LRTEDRYSAVHETGDLTWLHATRRVGVGKLKQQVNRVARRRDDVEGHHPPRDADDPAGLLSPRCD
jgi:hypothetical protein